MRSRLHHLALVILALAAAMMWARAAHAADAVIAVSPEATFFTELASGRLPFAAALLAVLVYALRKSDSRLEKLTSAVEALPAALAAHREAVVAGGVELKSHITSQADRVIGVIEDRRLSEVGEALVEVKRSASNPGMDVEPPQTRRGASGTRSAVR